MQDTQRVLGRKLYEELASRTAIPRWDQCGEVTRSVWYDRAKLKLAGHPRWWSCDPDAVSLSRIREVLQECMKMDLNHEQAADTLDEIAALFSKLSGTFRPRAGGAESAGSNGKAASKPAAGKGKAAAVEEVDIDEVRAKLKELAVAKGKDKMVEALESVGAGALADVDESQYGELMEKAQELIDEDDEPPAKKPAAKKAAAKKKAGPTLDEVKEAAQALIDADKPAYLKLTKKLGKPSDMDKADYAAAIEAYQEAMPEEGEEDLM